MTRVLSELLKDRHGCKRGLNVAKTALNLNVARSLQYKPNPAGFALCRGYHSNGDPKYERQLPTLLYIQNPISWLINKIDFKMLKSAWDPEFDESEFKRGTIQAVSVICTLISRNMWDNLRGLVTRPALSRLRRDVEVNWAQEQRRHMFLEPSDIKLALPKKIHFLRVADKKFVDVDMTFVGLKFKDVEPAFDNDLIFVEMVARFHRNYSYGEIPNWTVNLFKVTRFSATPAN